MTTSVSEQHPRIKREKSLHTRLAVSRPLKFVASTLKLEFGYRSKTIFLIVLTQPIAQFAKKIRF
jgi:hypothetical protein